MDIKLKRSLLALFFPNRCPVCGAIIGSMERFCISCTGKLTPYTGTSRPPHTKSFTACFVYDENIRPAIMLLKRGVCGNADYALGMYLAEKLRENGISDRIDLLIPVPMSRSGKAERGFNQSELICKVVGRELGIPTARSAAAKIRSTLPQKSLGRMSRRVNVRNAFSVRKPKSSQENVFSSSTTSAPPKYYLRARKGARFIRYLRSCSFPAAVLRRKENNASCNTDNHT